MPCCNTAGLFHFTVIANAQHIDIDPKNSLANI
jgi:hypothetical protein